VYQTDTAAYPEARTSITSVVLAVIIASIVYLAVALVSEMVVLATEESRRAQLAAASKRKLGGKKGASGALALGPAAAQGSLYHSADLKRRGVSGGGPVETSFNPLTLGAASARSLGAGGSTRGLDVAESVAAMDAPPPPEVWRMVQAAFLQLHTQASEERLRASAQALGVSAPDPMGGDADDGSRSPARRAFAPTASGSEPESAAAALRSFRASARGPRSAGSGPPR